MKPRLCLLGQPRLEGDGTVVLLPLDRSLWLLALVAVPGDWVRRSAVADLIWDDGDSDAIAKRLRQLLYRTKNLGFGTGIEFDAGRLRWAGTCDLLEWRAAVQSGDDARAVELASGGLLAGVVASATEFGAWLALERQSFLATHQQTVLRHAARLERDGQFLSALSALERCCQIMPMEQDVLIAVLRFAGLADVAQRGHALFQAHQKELLEIAQTPSPELLIAVQRLEQPLWSARPSSLPQIGTVLFGRESELAAMSAWIASDARLLSVVGIGGIGKTSLALGGLRQTTAVFVPLAGFTGGSLTSSVATALGAVLPGQTEVNLELLAWLSRRPAQILLLDNVEQCLAATRDFIALIAPTRWRVVVTSRSKLALRAEQIIELEGLACPASPTDLGTASALLFLAAAKRVSARFALKNSEAPALVRLCNLLAGTPLALELAASWLRLLNLAEITEEVSRNLDFLEGGLQHLPAQQNGLRAVFTHSYKLLSLGQQVALARLAIFRGGFTQSAALEITGISHRDLLALTDASLIKRTARSQRWQVHELIRQYASEHLHADPLEWQRVAQAHAGYYLGLARVTRAAQLHEEADNFRDVLTWSVSGHDAGPALELATALRSYWFGRGLVQEGSAWLSAALDLHLHGDQLAVKARLVLAEFLQTQGQSGAAQAQLNTAQSVARDLARTDLESLCQTMYARIAHRQSHYEAAMRHCTQALRLAGDDMLCQAAAYRWLGRAEIFKGDLSDATLHIETALQVYRTVADHEAVAHCLNSLALIATQRKDYAVSRACFQEALRLHQNHREKYGQALNLSGLGWLEFLVGDLSAAQAFTEQSLELLHELGHQWEVLNAQLNLGHIASKRPAALEAHSHYRAVLRDAAPIGATSLQLEALVGMAYLLEDKPDSASELLGAALEHPQVNHEIVSFAQGIQTLLKTALGDQYNAAYERGQARGLEATLRWVLADALAPA